MSTYVEILQAALTLPPRERGDLADLLWASVPDETPTADNPSPLGDGWRAEILRRSAGIDAGTAKFVTWEQMKERAHRAAGHEG